MAAKHVVKVFRVKMSEKMSDEIEDLISDGTYVTYADAVRQSLALLIKEHEKDLD